MLALTLQGVM